MKVIELRAQNLKRLKAVEIRPDPDGHVVEITGRNGQGKTSVLDAIWFALAGGAATRDTSQPIRDGEKRATVELDLGDFTIKRVWEEGKSTVIVTSKELGKITSPQKFLDEKLGALSFDPLEFAGMAAKDQRRLLLELVHTDVDIEDIDRRRSIAFDQRTEANRLVRDTEGDLVAHVEPEGEVPDEEISAASIIAAQRTYQLAVNDRENAREAIRRLDNEIIDLQLSVETAKQNIEDLRPAANAEIMEVPNADEQLADIEATNVLVRAKKHRAVVVAGLRDFEARAQALSDLISELDGIKQTALEGATLPIEALGFDEDGVLYQGIPFKQCSAAEQLRVSVAMAMALNPTIRIIRVADGSLLDSANMAVIAEMATDKDFQVWIERVDETGEIGFTIEDGEVVHDTGDTGHLVEDAEVTP